MRWVAIKEDAKYGNQTQAEDPHPARRRAPPRRGPLQRRRQPLPHCRGNRSRRWRWFYRKPNGKRGEIGLGSATGARGRRISRDEARIKANALADIVAAGGDPKEEEAKGETLRRLRRGDDRQAGADWRSAPHRTQLAPLPAGPFRADRRPADLDAGAELSPRIKAFLDPIRFQQWDVARKTRQALSACSARRKGGRAAHGREPRHARGPGLGEGEAQQAGPAPPAVALRGRPCLLRRARHGRERTRRAEAAGVDGDARQRGSAGDRRTVRARRPRPAVDDPHGQERQAAHDPADRRHAALRPAP